MDARHRRQARRAVLGTIAGMGALRLTATFAAATAGSSTPAAVCVLTPAMTEGPFFVDERLDRSDLVGDSADPAVRNGYPLELALRVVGVREGCQPLPGMQVDVWHTDAMGRYSDVEDQRGKNFCRGYQRTDAQGSVRFRTIYPGWYPGRTIHIHVKVRGPREGSARALEFTTQIFFDEATNDAVMAMPPYDSRGPRTTRNARDGLYRNATSLLARTEPLPRGARGLAAAFTLGLDLPPRA